MSFDVETLYKLLPAFNQVRDIEAGNSLVPGKENAGPLKALLSLLAEQIAALEENFDQLYDDQFIETCAEWVVPYIGDLVGARGLTIFPGASFSERGEVANTLSYRRRKGTASVIEQLARDVTGWNASVVEYFQLLATTQYLNHLRPENFAMASVRNWERWEYINTPFDKVAHTADVRNIARNRGKYNIPNIGIYLWRLQSFSSRNAPAYKVDDYRYKFDALGLDRQLYNKPQPEESITHLSGPINVPSGISRRVMSNDPAEYYGSEKSILIYKNGAPVLPRLNPPEELSSLITICNLSDIKDVFGNVTGWVNVPEHSIALDPVLGRIAFPTAEAPPREVHVDYYYGFSDKMGGGDYGRIAGFSTSLEEIEIVRVPHDKPALQEAIDQLASTGGVIEIGNNERYAGNLSISLAAGKKLEIRAADKMRPLLELAGDLEIVGKQNAEIHFNGLLICGGSLHLPLTGGSGETNALRTLYLQDCTLFPGLAPEINRVTKPPSQPGLLVEVPGVVVKIDRSIVGALCVTNEAVVNISNSIVDATADNEIAYSGMDKTTAGASLQVENSTIIGKVKTVSIKLASNTIFFASPKSSPADEPPVLAERIQEGCIRFSYVPPGSKVPRQYHCLPGEDNTAGPVFTSLQYGDPGYCQLSRFCSIRLRQGADDDAEMGAFHNLYQPQREQNLRTRLNEYLRFGLEAGIYYAS